MIQDVEQLLLTHGIKYQKIAICGKCGLAKYKVVE